MTFRKLLFLVIALVCVTVAAAPGGTTHQSLSTRLPGSRIVPRVAVPASDPYLFSEARTAETVAYLAGIAAQERAGAEASRNDVAVTWMPARPVAPAATSGECQNPVVPESVMWRESRCDYGAVNANGCSGRSCVGAYQLDLGHFAAVSPWNPNVSGVCYGLGDWHDPAVQTACASRLGANAWG